MKNIKSLSIRLFAAVVLIILNQKTFCQSNPYPINLETVLKLTGANNLTVQEYQLKYQQALAERSKANEWWLPNIYAGASTHYLHGAAMNTDGKIFSDVNRNNLWTGSGIYAEIDFSRGIYSVLAAKQKAQAANYFSAAEKNKTILYAVQTYFDLQAEQLKYIFLQSLTGQADTLSQQIKIKVEGGLMYQSEYLLSQSNFQHLKIALLQSKVEWQKKSALLVNLLNLENNICFVSANSTLLPLTLNVQPADSAGFDKRPEFLSLKSELQSIKTGRKIINQGLLMPKLKLGYDNGGFGAYNSTLYNTYQFNASLLWNLPLGRLTYKGDLRKYNTQILAQQNKMEQFKNQYQQETAEATAQLQIANEQMSIAKLALQSSTEALNQSLERQKLGTAKAFEVFQAQQFLLQAQVDYLKSVSEYNKAQFALKVAKGELL